MNNEQKRETNAACAAPFRYNRRPELSDGRRRLPVLESTMDLDAIRALADEDMQAVNRLIGRQLQSDVALIQQLGFYIISGGGKRLRPLLTVLAARAVADQGNERANTLAAIIEFIHTATLLHDDVVDESTLRRGRETANALFGNQASVLVGDFLYTRSFQMMVSLENMTVMQVLADATNVIAEGEVMQLMNIGDPSVSEARYFEVIYCKTAKLFEAATRLAATVSNQPQHEQALADYGRQLGTAFQLIDDLLDYDADETATGKHLGDDLAEGKPTLPLLHALAHGNDNEQALIREAIEQANGLPHMAAILTAMRRVGSLDYTRQRAEQAAEAAIQALASLPPSHYRDALASLARLAVARDR